MLNWLLDLLSKLGVTGTTLQIGTVYCCLVSVSLFLFMINGIHILLLLYA